MARNWPAAMPATSARASFFPALLLLLARRAAAIPNTALAPLIAPLPAAADAPPALAGSANSSSYYQPAFLSAVFDSSQHCRHIENHPPHTVDYRKFCDSKSSGCWPALYLLGVQKAATTSIAVALMKCGSVAFGMPDESTGSIGTCGGVGVPCKETLHPPIDIRTKAGQGKFEKLYDLSRCDHITDRDSLPSKPACYAGRFLEATPLGVGENTPDVAMLLQLMPPQIASRARFAVIFREPVSRLLSWYNHVVSGGNYYGDDPKHYTSFDTFYRVVVSQQADEFEMGKYVGWLEQFTRSKVSKRHQLLVLSFDSLLFDTAAAVGALTTHYGLPYILTNTQALPEENTHDGPRKVVAIKCSTRTDAWRSYKTCGAHRACTRTVCSHPIAHSAHGASARHVIRAHRAHSASASALKACTDLAAIARGRARAPPPRVAGTTRCSTRSSSVSATTAARPTASCPSRTLTSRRRSRATSTWRRRWAPSPRPSCARTSRARGGAR